MLIPNPKRFEFGLSNFLWVSIFLTGQKGDKVKVMINNEENHEFVNFPDFGRQAPITSTLEGGTIMGMNIKKSVRKHMSSKGKLQF